MSVKLISLTKPINAELMHLTPEEFIVYIARVSNPQNQLNTQTAPKLLHYCIKNGHWSIFEHVYATFEIETTRAIAAQILRHRSFTFQEYSLRYANASLGFERIEARLQDTKNRQNSLETDDSDLKQWFSDAQQKVWELSYNLYNDALARGIAKEQARFLLPLNTKTRLYMTGNLRSWIHYIQLRADASTQKEHRIIALKLKDILEVHFPNTFAALDEKKEI
ncbi:MAG: FAD-dependent thymidylate synthase [Bacteroidia bacterium]|nr:FAD-dependent thymidylate synthase [Bacteroidia bacterium]